MEVVGTTKMGKLSWLKLVKTGALCILMAQVMELLDTHYAVLDSGLRRVLVQVSALHLKGVSHMQVRCI